MKEKLMVLKKACQDADNQRNEMNTKLVNGAPLASISCAMAAVDTLVNALAIATSIIQDLMDEKV